MKPIFLTIDTPNAKELLERVAAQAREEIVGNMSSYNACGLVSIRIIELLQEENIWAKLITGKFHCHSAGRIKSLTHKWVRVGEWFVDASLDQFNACTKIKRGKITVLTKKPRNLSCPEDWYLEKYGYKYEPKFDYNFDTMYFN